MIVLDTDHFSELLRALSPSAQALRDRLANLAEDPFITVVTAEEVFRGWLSEIRRKSNVANQIRPYHEFQRAIASLASWQMLPWDAAAVAEFESLKQAKVRVGTMDLKVASIVLAHGGILLTRNRVDFERVPGLQLDDWLAA